METIAARGRSARESAKKTVRGALKKKKGKPIDIQSLVLEDMKARSELGLERYGKLLYCDDTEPRDMLWETYEELMDACVYIRYEIEKRGGRIT